MKIIIYICLMLQAFQVLAQENKIRAYTPSEIERETQVCNWLNGLIPSKMEDCIGVKTICNAGDWKEQPGNDNAFVSVDSKGRPLDYGYVVNSTFKRTDIDDNNSEIGKKKLQAMMDMLDEQKKGAAADKTYVAAQAGIMSKLEGKDQTSITVIGNRVADIDLTYHKSIQPKKITLPIPASYSMLFAAPEKFPLDENGQPEGQLISEVKGDVAIIVIGNKPATSQVNWDGIDKYKLEKITLNDVTPLGIENGIRTAPKELQNVVVRIEGDQDNIKSIIAQIDWNKVKSYIGK
ncbi:MAG: hypothetical protein HYZ42_02365 [Bacteroidetes bacterium]|nr:hypothetical protein [Bacteroidota bacterium]